MYVWWHFAFYALILYCFVSGLTVYFSIKNRLNERMIERRWWWWLWWWWWWWWLTCTLSTLPSSVMRRKVTRNGAAMDSDVWPTMMNPEQSQSGRLYAATSPNSSMIWRQVVSQICTHTTSVLFFRLTPTLFFFILVFKQTLSFVHLFHWQFQTLPQNIFISVCLRLWNGCVLADFCNGHRSDCRGRNRNNCCICIYLYFNFPKFVV